jgi:2-polyprenyl-6-methoxyphenol hydroxylase-like FAD-dependent oxidoreductase
MRAVVVGGGIGGLAAAIGLRRAGWTVEVLERAPAPGEIGAGITLWPNALRALRALGLADQVAALSRPQRSGGLRQPSGRWLSRWTGPVIEERLGDPMIGIHRSQLHELLLDALPSGTVHFGVSADALPAADLVVGADGIDSRIRHRLFPGHPAPTYSGITAWRGVSRPDHEVDVAITWGRGQEVGVVPLADGRVYWYVAMNAPAGTRHDDERAFVLEQVGHWHRPIPELIRATPAAAVLHHDLDHLAVPLPSYVSTVDGRAVALLGDAAHAMTPHLGQGGCQALEDAAELMAAAARYAGDLPALLATYDARRRPRSQAVAARSLRIGRFTSGLANPVLVALRDAAIRLTPAGVSLRGMTAVADWTPPEVAARST